MSKASVFRNLLVGTAFLTSLAVLGYATLKVSDFSWISGDAYALEVRFPNVNQLTRGHHAVMHGYRIGQVESITYDPQENPDNPILVRVHLRAPIAIAPGTTFKVLSAGPLGGRYLEITPGTAIDPDAPVVEDQVYVGEANADLFQQLGQLIADNEGRIGDILEGLTELVNDLRTGEGVLPKALRDEELGTSFHGALKNFEDAGTAIKETFNAVNRSDGPLGTLVNDASTRDRMIQIFTDVAAIASSAREGDSIIRMLFFDAKAKEELRSVLTHLREISRSAREGDGIIRMLFFDAEAKEKLRSVLTDLREISRSAREGDGALAALLNDGELSRRLEDAVKAASEILVKINRGEGTLGQLVNNREVWDELRRILVQAREGLEDLREQAPIRTFANAIFATF